MIQRIQTVFLAFNFFFLIVIYVFSPGKFFSLILKRLLSTDYPHLVSLFEGNLYLILCVFLTLLSILFFKKRKSQLFINNFQIFIHLLYFTIILINFIISDTYNSLLYLIVPLVSMICIFLANKFIKKDEALIRSINRIR